MEELAVSRARDHLGEAVNQVQYGREMVYLTRHGRRVAALVPVEVLEAIEAVDDAEDVAEATAALAELGPDVPLAEIRTALGISARNR
jgi:prevent-host-death family protein